MSVPRAIEHGWAWPCDGEQVTLAGNDYIFSEAHAQRVIRFFGLLRHTKGRQFAGRPFNLQPWQRWLLGETFGWLRCDDGTRRYRTVFLFVPRKNGKSELGAGIGLYLLTADGELGAEVYAAAQEREQASIILGMAKSMVIQEPRLVERATPLKYLIHCADTNSTFKALSADAHTKHGLGPHGLFIDELHIHRNRDLIDTLVTGTGARKQPLTFITTTAGYDKHTICGETYDYAKRVESGEVVDPSFLPVIFEADEGDDWTDPATWAKANPNLGVCIEQSFLERECARAQESPSYEQSFKRLYLNIWTDSFERWIPSEVWDDCAGPLLTVEECEGREAYVGLDISSVNDITAMVAVLPREYGDRTIYDVICKFWVPAESIHKRSRSEGIPYDEWEAEGWIEGTRGRTLDQRAVKNEILRWCTTMDVRELVADRWNTSQLLLELAEHDITVVKFGQGFASMNEPTKAILRLALDGALNHGGHPVLAWMIGNCVIEKDAADNWKPSKKHSTEKIDGVTSLAMALGRALCHATEESVYDDGGRGLSWV